MSKILFYRPTEPYFELSNFYLREQKSKWLGRKSICLENLYQAAKFYPEHPELVDMMINAKSPEEAFDLGRKYRNFVRADWFKINVDVMKSMLEDKFCDNEDMKKLLLGTGDRVLVENSPRDEFWGCGKNGNGKNKLGELLMEVRNELKKTL
jgi:ribA/ribD-fused uncharacterized protein